MIIKSLVYHDKSCSDVSLRGSRCQLKIRLRNGKGNPFPEQQASGESQIQGVQLQVFASDKAEKLLSSKLPTSQVHDLATGH